MTLRRSTLLLLAASLAVAVAGCSSAQKPSAGGSGSTSATAEEIAASDETPAVESLKGLTLADGQESLVLDYLRAGGLKALESRFGNPSKTYRTPVDESTTASAELADGRFYLVQCGRDASGAMVVMAHSVEALEGQTSTPQDTAFVDATVDGKTTLEEANSYMQKVGGTVELATVDPGALLVPALVWTLQDGSGFVVLDLTGLTAAQLEQSDMADASPWQALYWTPTHWRAY